MQVCGFDGKLRGMLLSRALLIVCILGCASGASAPTAPAPAASATPVASAAPASQATPTAPAAPASPATTAAPAPPTRSQGPPPDAALVEYSAGRKGFLYRPEGAGPFPVVVWNHGSERLPGWQTDLAHFYVQHGWAFFLPHRRGHGRSPGDYIGDEHDTKKILALQEEHNADVVAAIGWIKTQPGIDPARVVVSGCSFGGIQTMLVAGKDVGIRAAVPFAPGAIMWSQSPELRDRLTRAAREAKVPVFLVQAENDYDVSPSRIAGAELEKRDREHHRVHIYPPYGATAQDGHGGFCTRGFDVWGADVLEFLARATAKPALARPAASKHGS